MFRVDCPPGQATIDAWLEGKCRHGEACSGSGNSLRTMVENARSTIPLFDGQPMLGMWRELYLFEHRRGSHRRQVVLHLLETSISPARQASHGRAAQSSIWFRTGTQAAILLLTSRIASQR